MANRSGFEKFTHNRGGYRAVRRSPDVRRMLQTKADAVRRAAEASLPPDARDVYLIADTTMGGERAGATVIGVPMRLERSHRILGAAISAAG